MWGMWFYLNVPCLSYDLLSKTQASESACFARVSPIPCSTYHWTDMLSLFSNCSMYSSTATTLVCFGRLTCSPVHLRQHEYVLKVKAFGSKYKPKGIHSKTWDHLKQFVIPCYPFLGHLCPSCSATDMPVFFNNRSTSCLDAVLICVCSRFVQCIRGVSNRIIKNQWGLKRRKHPPGVGCRCIMLDKSMMTIRSSIIIQNENNTAWCHLSYLAVCSKILIYSKSMVGTTCHICRMNSEITTECMQRMNSEHFSESQRCGALIVLFFVYVIVVLSTQWTFVLYSLSETCEVD